VLNKTTLKRPSQLLPKAKFIAIAAGLILFFWVTYFDSLFWGYKVDDIEKLTLSWREWFQNPFVLAGRPVWGLSYLLTKEISPSPLFQRTVNLFLLSSIICVFVWYIYQNRMSIVSCLFLAAALSHPSFIWPITWIAQRNDLLLILFTGLSLLTLRNRWSIFFLIFALAAKTPFVFQSLLFSWRYFRAGRLVSASVALLLMPAFVYAGYRTYYAANLQQPVKRGLYAIDRDDLIFTLAATVIRAAKALEGIFYSFVPLGAYAGSSTQVAVAAGILLLAWCIILREVIVFLRVNGLTLKYSLMQGHPSFDLLAIGLLMCIAYGFGTGLRIYSPGLIFLFLGIAATAPATKLVKVSLSVIIAVYLWGVYLNYNANAGPCFSLRDPMEECNGPPVPANNWEALRGSIVDRIVEKYLNKSL
jgi:hypothetical protein